MLNAIDCWRPGVLCALVVLGAMTAPQHANAQCGCNRAVSGYASSEMGMAFQAMPFNGMTYPGMLERVVEEDAIYLTVNVPEKAILKVNGDPTISVGPKRYFVIRNLEPGRSYKFKIVAETANAAGVAMEETKTVKLSAGSTGVVSLKPIRRKGDPGPTPESEKASTADRDGDTSAAGSSATT